MYLLEFYFAYDHVILKILSYWMIFVGFTVFCSLLKHNAPYGRYSNYKYGRPVSARLSWFIMELPPVIITTLFYLLSLMGFVKLNYILMLYSVHYFYRSLIYSYLIKDGKPLPILTSFLALTFNIYNGTLQSLASINLTVDMDMWSIIGIFGFLIGLYINAISDHQLRMLRAHSSDGERYKIPRGKMFEYVSCGNYFGEILEWWCFALVMRSSASLAFALFTSFNLIPRALGHHKWYQEKFKDYPKHRKAVIPWII